MGELTTDVTELQRQVLLYKENCEGRAELIKELRLEKAQLQQRLDNIAAIPERHWHNLSVTDDEVLVAHGWNICRTEVRKVGGLE